MHGLTHHALRALVTVLLLSRFSPADADDLVLDFGVQPVSFPVVMFTEVMKRGRNLQAHLASAGWAMRQHPYFKGTDMIDLVGDGRLDAAVLGDIPTLYAVARHELCVAALMKHTFSSVVTRRYMPLSDLKGKRVGNAHGSPCHSAVSGSFPTGCSFVSCCSPPRLAATQLLSDYARCDVVRQGLSPC